MENNNLVKISFVNGQEITVEQDSRVADIINRINIRNLNEIMAVKVNNEIHSINHKVMTDSKIEILDFYHPEGSKIYAKTLIFVFIKAVHDLYPDFSTSVGNKISGEFLCKIENQVVTTQMVTEIRKRMKEIVKQNYPIVKHNVSYSYLKKIFKEMGNVEQEDNYKIKLKNTYTIYSCDGYMNYLYGRLAYSTGCIKGFKIRKANESIILTLPEEDNINKTIAKPDNSSIFRLLRSSNDINEVLNIHNVADLNQKILDGEIGDVVRLSEQNFEKELMETAKKITASNKIKIVLLTGPSSSGKTTTAQKLCDYLRLEKKIPHVITMDNYFLDQKDKVYDSNGKVDYESVRNIELDLFERQMNGLLDGKKVKLPVFNFLEGKKEYSDNILQLKENDLLVIEGIHALNPVVYNIFPEKCILKLYVAPLITLAFDNYTKVSSNDIRLLRRMVRDYQTRGISAEKTISLWANVRQAEEKNIHPFLVNADVMINTSLVYEVGVLKTLAENLLLSIKPSSEFYTEARRLYSMLENFRHIEKEYIPSTSIITEFIGGGCFKR